MDCKTFIVQILNTITWPVFTLIIIYCFRQELRGLLKSLSELKIGNCCIAFEKSFVANTISSNSSETDDTKKNLDTLTREEIMSISDEDYEFMRKIANNKGFMPKNSDEVFKYNSLINNGYFRKAENNDGAYEPTGKGQSILSALKNIYYSQKLHH